MMDCLHRHQLIDLIHRRMKSTTTIRTRTHHPRHHHPRVHMHNLTQEHLTVPVRQFQPSVINPTSRLPSSNHSFIHSYRFISTSISISTSHHNKTESQSASSSPHHTHHLLTAHSYHHPSPFTPISPTSNGAATFMCWC